MRKVKKYVLWVVAISFATLLLLFTTSYFYFVTHKASLLNYVTTNVARDIGGKITVTDVYFNVFKSFPSVSITLNDLQISDSLPNKHKPLLIAHTVLVRFNIASLLVGKIVPNKISISNASINIFTDSLGFTNSYLLQRKKTDASINKKPVSELIKKIQFDSTLVVISDAIKNKRYSFNINRVNASIAKQDSLEIVHINSSILIHRISFNTAIGSYASNQLFESTFDVVVNQQQPSFSFKNMTIQLSKQPFILSGQFLFTKEPTFNLQIQSKQIGYNFARSLVTPTIAKALLIASVEKPIDIDASIGGLLNSGDPLVNIKWVVKNNVLHNGFIDFTNCSFGGYYTNEVVANLPKKDPNSKIVATNFIGTWQGFVFTAPQIDINNLAEPNLICNLTSIADVTTFNNLLETNAIVAQSGKASLYLNYNGPLVNNNSINTSINGKISLRNAALLYTPKNVLLNNCSGDILFTENDFAVKNLNCNVEGNHIVMEGKATNILRLVNSATDKLNLEWTIRTASLNLQPLKRLFTSNASAKTLQIKKVSSLKAAQLNNVLTNSNITLQFQADKFLYQKFQASNVKATVRLLENKWIFNNTGLQHAGGNMSVNGTLTTLSSNNIKASVELTMQNMDVKTVMNSFNNFGLKGINANNLSGKFYTNVVANAMLNNELQPFSKTIEATVFFSIKNGSLINYEPFKAIQKFAFKNRDFNNLAFAELKDTVLIKKEMITIKPMEIASSALRMYVEGFYDINDTKTDLSFQIPLSNLRKIDTNYIPTNKGTNRNGGASIFIRARPNDKGELKFTYDVFKRFRKSMF